jgi:hypothetical protein
MQGELYGVVKQKKFFADCRKMGKFSQFFQQKYRELSR